VKKTVLFLSLSALMLACNCRASYIRQAEIEIAKLQDEKPCALGKIFNFVQSLRSPHSNGQRHVWGIAKKSALARTPEEFCNIATDPIKKVFKTIPRDGDRLIGVYLWLNSTELHESYRTFYRMYSQDPKKFHHLLAKAFGYPSPPYPIAKTGIVVKKMRD